ncbi:MAG: Helix-turn-helix domain [Acetobacteraceae bacterium]|nr:Helix-turn-helix domain [Acetobacteraceae bacterium]
MQTQRDRQNHPATANVGRDEAVPRREIGERIKSARQEAGLTQRELAKKLAVSAGAVGQWETGKVPATGRLAALADCLGVSLDWLLGTSRHVRGPARAGADLEEDLRLVEEARRLGIDLRTIVAEARQQRWITENRDALTDANDFLARHGLWSDGKRQF